MRCNLCPRSCGCDRIHTLGACGAGIAPRVARAMLHQWEEPPISGSRGAGAVFFSGCNLGCVFCQNEPLQSGALGRVCDAEQLCDLFLSLQQMGAHNIDLVTPTPHIPVLRRALLRARQSGLTIPVIYNTGAYERIEALRAMEGLVDVYLPDMKYVSPALSERFSCAADYCAAALPAIREMFRQTGHLQLDADGLASRGVLVRHLILPGCVDDTRRVLDALLESFSAELQLSLMRQYAPTPRAMATPLNRVLTSREYDRCISYALSLGFHNIWIQQKTSATLDFTPSFTD